MNSECNITPDQMQVVIDALEISTAVTISASITGMVLGVLACLAYIHFRKNNHYV